MNDFDRAEMKHDREKDDNYYPDENLCLRCEEEEAEPNDDYCEYCNDTIRHNNRDKFQAKETY